MPEYDETLSLREARVQYWAENGLPADGGYSDAWVVIRARGIPITAFPNTAMRRRAVKLHDLHHVLTGYSTDLKGESEIAAWELASGCGRYWAAWYLDGWAVLIGLVCWPRAVADAWRRGRRRRNFYTTAFDEAQLKTTVAAARRGMSIPPGGDATLSAPDPVKR